MPKAKTKREAVNPFASITPDLISKFAGQNIAVSLASGKIVAAAPSAAELRVKMQQDHRDTKYARVCLPNKRQ